MPFNTLEMHGPRSNASHLLRLSYILHYGSSPAIGFQDKRLDILTKREYRSFPNLTPPDDRGRITVADVVDALGPEEHQKRVMQWAQAVWNAYRAHHRREEETIRASMK